MQSTRRRADAQGVPKTAPNDVVPAPALAKVLESLAVQSCTPRKGCGQRCAVQACAHKG